MSKICCLGKNAPGRPAADQLPAAPETSENEARSGARPGLKTRRNRRGNAFQVEYCFHTSRKKYNFDASGRWACSRLLSGPFSSGFRLEVSEKRVVSRPAETCSPRTQNASQSPRKCFPSGVLLPYFTKKVQFRCRRSMGVLRAAARALGEVVAASKRAKNEWYRDIPRVACPGRKTCTKAQEIAPRGEYKSNARRKKCFSSSRAPRRSSGRFQAHVGVQRAVSCSSKSRSDAAGGQVLAPAVQSAQTPSEMPPGRGATQFRARKSHPRPQHPHPQYWQ